MSQHLYNIICAQAGYSYSLEFHYDAFIGANPFDYYFPQQWDCYGVKSGEDLEHDGTIESFGFNEMDMFADW